MTGRRVLVTGAAGYLGSRLVESLAARVAAGGGIECLVASDLREVPADRASPGRRLRGARRARPVGSPTSWRTHASTRSCTSRPSSRRARSRTASSSTRWTCSAPATCSTAASPPASSKIIVTSSGAAYGYHADNPEWLSENDPVRGNEAFAYSHHKRLVEEMLAEYRRTHPRAAAGRVPRRHHPRRDDAQPDHRTVRSAPADRDARLEQPVRLHLGPRRGGRHRACDRVATATGIYNVAGDGALGIQEIARPARQAAASRLPPGLLRAVLPLLHPLGLSQYGPEQVDFLRYRPVLDNRRLKEEFGYVPQADVRRSLRPLLPHARARAASRHEPAQRSTARR